MTTRGLLGGPQHGYLGEGPAPEGYLFVSKGNELPYTYEFGLRQAEEVYRWHEDERYIRDGMQILQNAAAGDYAVPPEYADLANATFEMALESLQVGVGIIADNPTSDLAQGTRESIDAFRERGLI